MVAAEREQQVPRSRWRLDRDGRLHAVCKEKEEHLEPFAQANRGAHPWRSVGNRTRVDSQAANPPRCDRTSQRGLSRRRLAMGRRSGDRRRKRSHSYRQTFRRSTLVPRRLSAVPPGRNYPSRGSSALHSVQRCGRLCPQSFGNVPGRRVSRPHRRHLLRPSEQTFHGNVRHEVHRRATLLRQPSERHLLRLRVQHLGQSVDLSRLFTRAAQRRCSLSDQGTNYRVRQVALRGPAIGRLRASADSRRRA